MQNAVHRPYGCWLMMCLILCTASAAGAAERFDYKPPRGGIYTMESHFAWCGEAKTPAERLKRYESFWELQRPEQSDGYDDSLHIRTVRRCAYRLAQLYAELNRPRDCVKMVKWLEKEDDTLKVAGE